MVDLAQGQSIKNHIGDEMIPVRCFTCGKVISVNWEDYKKRVEERKKEMETEEIKVGDILDELGIKRYCCRRMILSHAELVDESTKY